MIESVSVKEIRFNRSYYRPGESVEVAVDIESQVPNPLSARITVAVTHLTQPTLSQDKTFELAGGTQSLHFNFQPPPEAPRGYGLDICVAMENGLALACRTSAFDVLERWTDTPRYGFLTDFSPGRSDYQDLMEDLVHYHLNGLQFYDWMYRHEQFLTEEEPYLDPLGRELSRATVEALITAAHEHNIAAMPYTAVYAASIPFYEQHPDWALFKVNGQPHFFGENFLVYMDPRPGSPWTDHLLAQFALVLEQTAFDGIHLDQYGDPKEGYDADGTKFDLASPLADLIDATEAVVSGHRQQGSVVFNAVTNWPIEAVAPTGQDLIYIEVWPPYIWFEDLHTLITQAQELGNGKPVVLAAYISPSDEPNVRLVDAVIFASGGGHIELGERAGMLADPYFPNYEPLSSELGEVLRRYYEFAIRYQDLIGPRSRDVTQDYQERIELTGFSTSASRMKDKVWPIIRVSENFTAVNLINLVGLKSPEWRKPIEGVPQPLEAIQVKIKDITRSVSGLWLASPDGEDLSLRDISFSLNEGVLSFEIPSLYYWNLVVIAWSNNQP